MQLVTNTSEFNTFIQEGQTDIMQLPVNVNVLLCDAVSPEDDYALQRVARAARRSLHLC